MQVYSVPTASDIPPEPRPTLTPDAQTTTALLLCTDLPVPDISHDWDHTRYCVWLLPLSTILWRFILVTAHTRGLLLYC